MDPKPSPSKKRVELERNRKKRMDEQIPFGMTFVLIEELIAVPVMRF